MVGNIGAFGDRFPVNNQPKVSSNNVQEPITFKQGSEISVSSSPTATNPVGDQVIISTGNLKTDKNVNKNKNEVEDAWGETGASLVGESEPLLLTKSDVNPSNVKGGSTFTRVEVGDKETALIVGALIESEEGFPLLSHL